MMQMVKVGPGHRLLGEDCRRCNRKIRAGQVVLAARLSGLPAGQRNFTIHRHCLERMLADAPIDEFDWGETDDEFENLRARIIATGMAFPQ